MSLEPVTATSGSGAATGDPVLLELGPVIGPPAAHGHAAGARWVLRRCLLGLLTLFLVSLIVFLATQALPGDVARSILGRSATPESIAALRAQLGLDRSLVAQYLSWLGDLLTGDPGRSLLTQEPVWELLRPRLVNSLVLVALTAIVALPASLALGAWTAIRRDSRFDRTTLTATLTISSLPEFVVGILLIVLLGTTVFQVLPPVALIPPGDTPLQHLDAMVLPVLSLSLLSISYLYRLVRASTIDVLESDYVQMAWLKGLSAREVIVRHALPNALVPAIQASALVLAYLFGGIVVVEYLFGYPGIGAALVDAVGNHDLPVVQFTVLLMAGAYVVVNVVADLLTVLVTPRLRTQGR